MFNSPILNILQYAERFTDLHCLSGLRLPEIIGLFQSSPISPVSFDNAQLHHRVENSIFNLRNHPGQHLLLGGHYLVTLLPKIRGITPGSTALFKDKHKRPFFFFFFVAMIISYGKAP